MIQGDLVQIQELNKEIGQLLIEIAKKSIKEEFKLDKLDLSNYNNPILDKKGLAFVTLEKITHNTTSLRGCIGYVEAVAPLKQIVASAAKAAAFSDPRFNPLQKDELSEIIIEVTVLTKPEEIKVENRWDLPKIIKVGEDGLIVEKGILHSGLLLPQVPMEYCWDEETFLAETCIKASLEPDCWLDNSVTIKRFHGIIFRETRPNGSDIIVIEPRDIKCKLNELLNNF
ncbi:AmmeMemoRadiSam system protein A [Sulfolobus sp. E5-1-F]|uniref:AmmeMemoRadiSam system protein A n=1 Tax=Sulfolobaceae TaxID=118883 RepID=UPI001295D8E5|nr:MULTISPECIES: AmmeMemoRadiSam system protein A [unclassified Sulfolobus]QGA55001.1 AmmeMemoRadiSam system protein A [Sulfolobus sp. E5-1-F]QGA67825.1 AmmeMemoRadiSam system protein A [Sulfolobus sp. E11-6]